MTTARSGDSISLSALHPGTYQPHFAHSDNRIWRETNCYADLWIEVLHALGHDPVPSFVSALSADHDGEQWTFLKMEQTDLRILYGLEVTEDTLWRPVLDTVESGPRRSLFHTVEVDSWWLPDTIGTDYHSAHVKTTIVPAAVDRDNRSLVYFHNAGLFELSGDDFTGVFGLDLIDGETLPPYVEQVRSFADRAQPDAVLTSVREHLSRRAAGDPMERLARSIDEAVVWLPEYGLETFHQWAFATLRQCGASAELAADLSAYLGAGPAPGADAARVPFLEVAETAKSVQFKLARAARGRKVDVEESLQKMSASWAQAMDIVAAAVE
ncbi:UNVERIFIED_CONTAM: uncharacterized protein DUF1839 [Williamsia faeni]